MSGSQPFAPLAAVDKYLPRVIDRELDALSNLPAISITGARAIGKTATASRRAATIHRLDAPDERRILTADPSRLVQGPRPILIDEWQRLPESWDVVRRAVDDDREGSRFLLTGSAAPTEWPLHSGAGRIVNLHMRPLSLAERGLATPSVSLSGLLSGARLELSGDTDVTLADYAGEIVRSGLPGIRGSSDREVRAQLDGYIAQVVEHDVPEGGGLRIRNPARLTDWLTAYAAATSSTASRETIRVAATGTTGDRPARPTIDQYEDVLQRLWLLEPLAAWLPTRNRISRLSQPRKHHLVDPALAARLMGLSVDTLLAGTPAGPAVPREGPILGALFESLAVMSVRTLAQAAEARVFHLRTKGGEREIDLIVERKDGRVLAIEVKLGGTADDRDVRHLAWLEREIGPDLIDKLVITTGKQAYRRRDGVGVVPAVLLGS
ncbi:MAG: DUF4143 domain-containing protein [Candidatus Limnocylindrales bacterium]